MKQVDLMRLAVKLLKKIEKEAPQKSFTNASGEKATLSDVIGSLERLVKWMYPELSPEDIEKVVRCKRCRFYKRYKKKGSLKGQTFRACSKDMQKRDPMFFCKDGEESLEISQFSKRNNNI